MPQRHGIRPEPIARYRKSKLTSIQATGMNRPIVIALQYIEVGTEKSTFALPIIAAGTFSDGIPADKICNCTVILQRVRLSIHASGASQFLFLQFLRRMKHFPTIFCFSGTPFFEAELVLIDILKIILLPVRYWITRNQLQSCNVNYAAVIMTSRDIPVDFDSKIVVSCSDADLTS